MVASSVCSSHPSPYLLLPSDVRRRPHGLRRGRRTKILQNGRSPPVLQWQSALLKRPLGGGVGAGRGRNRDGERTLYPAAWNDPKMAATSVFSVVGGGWGSRRLTPPPRRPHKPGGAGRNGMESNVEKCRRRRALERSGQGGGIASGGEGTRRM